MKKLLILLCLFISISAEGQDIRPLDTVIHSEKDSAIVKLPADTLPKRVYKPRFLDKDTICYAMMSVVLRSPKKFTDDFYKKYPTYNYNLKRAAIIKVKDKIIDKDRLQLIYHRPDWIIYLLFFILSFFAWIKYRYGKYIDTIIESFFNGRAINQLMRDDDFFKSRPSILLFFLTVFSGGLLYYDIIYHYRKEDTAVDFLVFLKGMLLVAALILIKIVLLRLIGFIFAIPKIIKSYITIIYTVTYFSVLFSLPLLVCFAVLPLSYSGFLINSLIILAIGNLLLHYIRGSFFVISNFQFPKFYLFIYLCALELAPLLVLIKILS